MECHICLGTAPPAVLQPCACRGSKGVHLECLGKFFLAGGIDQFLTRSLHCSICGAGFKPDVSLHLAYVANREVENIFASGTESSAEFTQYMQRRNTAKLNLALALLKSNRSDEAVELSKQVFNERMTVLKLYRDSPPVIEAAHNYALNLGQLGRFDEAEALLKENVEIGERHGAVPPENLIGLAWIRTEIGTPPMLQQAEQILRNLLKDIHHKCQELPMSIETERVWRNASSFLAANLALQGQHAEEAVLWRKTLAVSRRTFGDQSKIVQELIEQERAADVKAAQFNINS